MYVDKALLEVLAALLRSPTHRAPPLVNLESYPSQRRAWRSDQAKHDLVPDHCESGFPQEAEDRIRPVTLEQVVIGVF